MTEEVERIKAALRRCRSIQAVNLTARHYAGAVADLARQGGDMAVMAIQIRNLAAYRRLCIRNGWATSGEGAA